MTIVVFTAALGQTDPVRSPVEVDPDAVYLCFADDPAKVPPPYEWMPTLATDSPRDASRRVKILTEHPRLASAEVTLWHDASYQLLQGFKWLRHAFNDPLVDLVAMAHPRRKSIEAEGRAIAKYGYLTSVEALAHVARYRRCGFTANSLTSGGLLGRRMSYRMCEFGRVWWSEVQLWGGRDQGSLDFAAFACDVRIRHIRGVIKDNRYARWRQVGEPEPEAVQA